MNESATHAAIEAIARNSYGRLIAYIAARSGDVVGAEDALGDAIAVALERSPRDGVPQKPEAWLLHAARNRVIDAARRHQVRQNAESFLRQIAEEAQAVANTSEQFPDERLKLLFVCAHPAIDAGARTPLMLQTVLGVEAGRIASAFLVSPAAMSQRLVRAKNKIRDAGIPFRVPEPPEWNVRVTSVLEAIYSAYTTGWESLMDVSSTHHALAGDAIAIGRTLVQLMPAEPEAHGLLALMLHCEAGREARYSTKGEFVPIDQQETSRWSRSMIDEAEDHLRSAAKFKRMGRYQLEAAIQSVHAGRGQRRYRLGGNRFTLRRAGANRTERRLTRRASRRTGAGGRGGRRFRLARRNSERSDCHLATLLGRARPSAAIVRSERRGIESLVRATSLTDDPALREYLFKSAADTPIQATNTKGVFHERHGSSAH